MAEGGDSSGGGSVVVTDSSGTSSTAIPIIDFSPFLQADVGVLIPGQDPTEEQRQVADAIHKACAEHGFIYLTGFGMTNGLKRRLFAAAKELFALDESIKLNQLQRITPQTNTGYSPYQSESLNQSRPNELKEAFNVRFHDDATDYSYLNTPGIPTEFRTIVLQELLPLLKKTARLYAIACALALDLPDNKFFRSTLEKMNLCTVRFLHSPPISSSDDIIGSTQDGSGGETLSTPLRVGEHTDFGAFTFLLHGNQEHGADGLQIQPVEGGEFVSTKDNVTNNKDWQTVIIPSSDKDDKDVDHVMCGAIVNTGAMMARWTNDHWRATAHRVIVSNPEMASRHRYSMAFFVDPDATSTIQVPDSVLKPGETPKYNPISSSDYLKEKLNNMMTSSKKDNDRNNE